MAIPAKRADRDRYASKDLRNDAQEAFQRAQGYHRELQDIYRYFMPFRQPLQEHHTEAGRGVAGDPRTNHLFDGTAPSSAFAFVANMRADWWPSFQNFFALENGKLFQLGNDEETVAARARQLQATTEVAHALLRPVSTVGDEMFLDLFAGTGHLLLSKGDKRQTLRGEAVPPLEVALDKGPWNELERWFRKRPYKLRHLQQLWPDGKFSDRINAAMKQTPNEPVEVIQYTYWDRIDETWRLCVWCAIDAETEFHYEPLRTNPWVSPRLYVVPGEAHGRGLAHMGLPFAKTVNKARELALQAAAFALLGLWTRRDDRVFNPKTANMQPGAMWKVGSNGGALGRTIERLDIPHNFDVSTIVTEDERAQMRRVLLDDELPELADRVRSPTEIAGRMRRYDRNRGGATVRLANEFVRPMAQRTIDLMEQLGMLQGKLTVDQVLTEAVVTAPAAAAQRSDYVERAVSFAQILTDLFGPDMTRVVAKVEKLSGDLGRDMGIKEEHLRDNNEKEAFQQTVEQAVEERMAQIAEQMKQQGGGGAGNGAAPQAQPEPQAELEYLGGVQ